tara:strand:+ start:208 stop:720 length:513 start_codon:yes stop_codon:yes gene_type:complete
MYKNAYGDETIVISSTGNYDYSQEPWKGGDKTILVTAAMADGNYIRLPEATTANAGMTIKVVLGIAVLDDLYVGFVSSVIQGGAVAMGDTNEAAGGAADHASAIADVADGFNSVHFNLDTTANAGGTGGTIMEFYYTGVADKIVYRGSLISEIDAPTLSGHFSTTAVNAF